MLITVHVNHPAHEEDIEFELDDDATTEQIEAEVETAFYNVCNYGYSINGEPQ